MKGTFLRTAAVAAAFLSVIISQVPVMAAQQAAVEEAAPAVSASTAVMFVCLGLALVTGIAGAVIYKKKTGGSFFGKSSRRR